MQCSSCVQKGQNTRKLGKENRKGCRVLVSEGRGDPESPLLKIQPQFHLPFTGQKVAGWKIFGV